MSTMRLGTGAIVLAGGRSARFGVDKLSVKVDGQPLLWLAISAAQRVASEVVVAAGPGATLELPPGVRLANDATAYDGPLAGVATGLGSLMAERALILAGDMPSLVPAVLARLLDALDDPAVDAVLLGSEDPAADPGRPLPMAVRSAPARESAATLLGGGERRLRALPGRLHATAIPWVIWRADDPSAASLRDVDVPGDLDA
jgi:molybdopterin-guanine dinucleotide biosynthesis protein A